MLVKNIVVYSTCEHHLLPIVGRAHVAYISTGKVIGLSKINRIVDHFLKRPQVQERLPCNCSTSRSFRDRRRSLYIRCQTLRVNSRGIKDIESSTVTAEYGGVFKESKRKELLNYINLEKIL